MLDKYDNKAMTPPEDKKACEWHRWERLQVNNPYKTHRYAWRCVDCGLETTRAFDTLPPGKL